MATAERGIRAGLRLAAALAVLGAGALGLGLPAVGFLLAPRPPAVAEDPGQVRGRRERYGDLIHLHLEGDAGRRGYDNGLLCGDLIAGVEGELHQTLCRLVPSFAARHVLLGLVALAHRGLPGRLRPAELREVAGLAAGYRAAGDPHAAVGPADGRLLQYHALHDASQILIDNPLVVAPAVGCTAVAVGAGRSATGRLLVGRLFDFEGGRRFDTHKVVRTVRPDTGHAYLSIDWGGVAGAVTGLNDAGLWLSLNAGATATGRFAGRPLVVIGQEILATCATIDAATAVLAAAEVGISEAVLLAEGPTGRAAVVEKGPGGCAVRLMADDLLVVTNHFLAPAWEADPANAARRRDGTTTARHARATELVVATPRHDPASLLALLRDRRGAGGADRGFRHRGTINAWIGTHLVVADPGAGVVWVAESPYGLGRAWAFDVHGPRPDLEALPAAPDLDLCRDRLDAWIAARETALAALAASRYEAAVVATDEMRRLNPQHYEGYWLAARAEGDAGHRMVAARTALALDPPYAAERAALAALLAGRAP
jgi:hypothetical protein